MRMRLRRAAGGRRAADSSLRARATGSGRPFSDPLIGTLDVEGVNALMRLYGDACQILRSGGRHSESALLAALLAAFAQRSAVAWRQIFLALVRIEAAAVMSGTPAMRRIRAFLQENADLAESCSKHARLSPDGSWKR